MFFCLVPVHFRVKNRLPRHRMVQLLLKIGKIWTFDNIFFGELYCYKILNQNMLQFRPVFLSHSWTGFGHKLKACDGDFCGAKFGIKDALQWHEKSWQVNK